MKKILITLPVEKGEKEAFYHAVENGGDYAPVFAEESELTEEMVRSASAVIGMIPVDLLPAADRLEWLQLGWAGAEQYCEKTVLRPGVILTNASGAYGNAVSEHMVALTLALACSLQTYIRQQDAHCWELRNRMGVMAGSTVLVYGMGDIGSRYAAVMKSMGATVIGISRTQKETPESFDEQYVAEDAHRVIGRADVIALALPGGMKTKHMIGRDAVSLMKRGVILVNAGRGSTLDTAALIEGLRDGTIGGAGLDVFEEEPLGESELWDMENVIITPHAAGKLENEFNRKRVVNLCLDNLRRYTHGEALLHIVDREFFY